MAKNPAAVALGRRGGKKKVPKGTAMLDPAERKARAEQAAAARWGVKTPKKK
jgi:hypothetical protein